MAVHRPGKGWSYYWEQYHLSQWLKIATALVVVSLFIMLWRSCTNRHSDRVVHANSLNNAQQHTASEQVVDVRDQVEHEYTMQAREWISQELGISDSELERSATIKCLSVYSSKRNSNSYGMRLSLVVITARFQVKYHASGRSQTYTISETLESDRFHGLDDYPVVSAIAEYLYDEISVNLQ